LLKKLSEIIKDARTKIQNQISGRSAGKSVYYANYKVMKETGPDHDKKFVVGVFWDRAGGRRPRLVKQEAEEDGSRAGT